MTPDTIFTGLVTTKLSSAATALDSQEFKTNYEEYSQRCLRTLSDANVDVRTNAIGFYTQWTVLGVAQKLNDDEISKFLKYKSVCSFFRYLQMNKR